VNSEELELSLRTEFEEHLKNVLADMRQEVAQLQEKVEAEFEKHKSQLSEVFRDFSARIATEKELDAGFSESVVEHLRLARDEGARITATAIAEAEEMQQASAQTAAEVEPSVGISDLRDAINDISKQTSQSSILKTLVQHAGKFTARGAFFILKNEHFVGWRVFGSKQEESDDQTIREIFFPVSVETVLGESVRSLSAVESSYGSYAGDSTYLDKLGFGQPDRMFAVPLIARGRGVAVLYADSGEENEAVNIEALETLVRVAGLTVEVTASSPAGTPRYEAPPAAAYTSSAVVAQPQKVDKFDSENDYQTEERSSEMSAIASYQPEAQFDDTRVSSNYDQSFDNETVETVSETNYESPGDNFSYQSDRRAESAPESFSSDDYAVEIVGGDQEAVTQDFQHLNNQQDAETAYGQTENVANYSWDAGMENFPTDANDTTDSYQSSFQSALTEDFSVPATIEYQPESNQYESGQSLSSPQVRFEETAAFDDSQYESSNAFAQPSESLSFAKEESYGTIKTGNELANDFNAAPAQPFSQPVASPPVKSRFSDRNVDLPIEVSEDERRLHNDARRFARLLVSEIKLYNEQKVKEGRESRDLYERLREAIDRSREMYDKRVQPPVAAKFDYFHYELVSTLAEGEPAKLGGSYQGAAI
jgi:hypothetical protein